MEQKQPEKRKHGKRYVLVGSVLVILSIVGCATPAPLPTLTPDAVATQVAQALAVGATLTALAPTVTNTPFPTDTPTPTETATMTGTPAVAPTPTPQLSHSSLSSMWFWALETKPQIDIVADAAQMIVSLLKDPQFGDANWTTLIAAQVVRHQEADAALRRIVPPEECREAHAILLSATGDGLLGLTCILKEVQQLDPDLPGPCSEYIASAAANMNLFELMLEAMTP